jgi:hypothetical protein
VDHFSGGIPEHGSRSGEYCNDPDTHNHIKDLAYDIAREKTQELMLCQGSNKDVISITPTYPLPNVWLGVSAEDQTRYDQRKEDLRNTSAAVHFFSFEPLLGPIAVDYLGEWAIVGGESGPKARPMHPDWARDIRDKCKAAGVEFHFKQWGEWVSFVDRVNDDPDWRAEYSLTTRRPKEYAIINYAGGCGFHGEKVHMMRRIGKARAGRQLDSQTHDGIPEARA